MNINDVIYGYRISGYLQFWRSIEPDNEFVLQSIAFMQKKMVIKKSDSTTYDESSQGSLL